MFAQKTPLILGVADDPEWLALLSRWLNKYEVIGAERCANALEILEKREPDLILLNAAMPDMDGFGFCAKMQERVEPSLTPVVLLVGPELDQDRALALVHGGVEYLVKPVRREKLLFTVEKQLETRKSWRAPLKKERPSPPADIRGFLDYLLNKLHVPPEERGKFTDVAPEDIYSLAPKLGIEAARIAHHVAAFTGCSFMPRLNHADIDLGVLPAAFCKKHQVIPARDGTHKGCFVLTNPFDNKLLDELQGYLDPALKPSLIITSPENITALFKEASTRTAATLKSRGTRKVTRRGTRKVTRSGLHGATGSSSMTAIESELGKLYQPDVEAVAYQDASEESAPIIKLVNKIIDNACQQGASDIHIEPWENEVLVRYRIDGDLRTVNRFQPPKLILPITARIKIMSHLSITERRLPQDGRIVYKENIDLRVATAPMNYGEKIVMRILDRRRSTLPLESLGFSDRHLKIYRDKIQTPYGMVLHVGPTGSGKSLTLFAALKEIQKPELNIQTIEDPIEYTLPGVCQMQTHAEIGLTFQRGLRSFLRQDPDVILVGEIRDKETAEIAVEAALTGHLLLSTLHTNDASATIVRLIEMGIEPYLVSSSIILVCAQRLLRRLCVRCRQKYDPSEEEKALAGIAPGDPAQLVRSTGCPECGNVGYKGRTGTHEILVLDDELRHILSSKGISSDLVKGKAVDKGMTTLYWDAMEKARQGVTSFAEVISQVRKDDFDSRPSWMLEELGQKREVKS